MSGKGHAGHKDVVSTAETAPPAGEPAVGSVEGGPGRGERDAHLPQLVHLLAGTQQQEQQEGGRHECPQDVRGCEWLVLLLFYLLRLPSVGEAVSRFGRGGLLRNFGTLARRTIGRVNFHNLLQKTPLEELLYMADNLAYFSYQLQDEPLFIIHQIDIILSVSGFNLLQSFKEVSSRTPSSSS